MRYLESDGRGFCIAIVWLDLLYPSVAQEIASLVMDCLNVAAISSDNYVIEGQSIGNTTLLLKKSLFVMKSKNFTN